MTKQSLNQQWDQLRQKYSSYLRLLEAMPANRYHTRLVPGMGTPAELVVQMSAAIVRDIAQGVAEGEIRMNGSAEARIVAALGTKAAVIAYARKCWTIADEAVSTIGDTQLNATIPTPWNFEITGWIGFNILNDEFLHHYGQLYTYARLCGAEPPFLWGFAESSLQYRFAD
ncbi:MAG TPA: DinB family protein [Terriglobia bacterium]|nr:DinB family protein [Terriglobia bacterium]